MFILPKKLEHTLRSPIIPATPVNPGSGLNPAFHKGCTGKSHACGTIKSKLKKPIPPPRGEKVQRKSSISSDTISDSGSEIYNSAIWNVSISSHDNTKEKEEKIQNIRKDFVNKSPLLSKRVNKTSPSQVLKRSYSISGARIRLHSEGEQNLECNRQSPVQTSLSTLERTQKYRSFRSNKNNNLSSNKNIITTATNIRPPWNSAAAGMRTTPSSTINVPLNTRIFRSSLRRHNEAASWQAIWERSFQMRGYGSSANGGYLKNFEETLKKKVWNFDLA